MTGHDTSEPVRAVFLAKSRTLMRAVSWSDAPDGQLEFPTMSPVLGRLTVSFEGGHITLHFGPHHRHFVVYPRDATGQAESAAQALAFIQDLVTDRIVVRWGARGSRTLVASRRQSAPSRLWRALTPWVREAVWSGRELGASARRRS